MPIIETLYNLQITVLTEVPQAGKANPYVEYLCISVKIHICPFQTEGM